MSVCLFVRLSICLLQHKVASQYWSYLNKIWYTCFVLLHAVYKLEQAGSDRYIV